MSTIIVDEYYPYTFVNNNGDPDGFSVDLMKAVTQVMGMELQISVNTWEQAKSALQTGEIDFLPMMAYSKERDKVFDFSVPHTIAYDAFFVGKNSIKIKSIDDLKGKTVIVMKDDQAHDYLRSTGLLEPENLILIGGLPEALRLLASGKGDAALMPKLVGLIVIKNLNLTNLEQSPVVIEAYHRPFSFAVKEGNQALLERLSQGLTIVKTTGQYSEIYEKWFGALEPKGFSLKAVLKYTIGFLTVFIFIGSVLILWSLSLKKQVALRTRNLRDEIFERKQSEEALRESEERLRAISSSTPDHILMQDSELRYSLVVNPQLGLTEQDMLGKTDYDFFSKEEADKLTRIKTQVLETGKPVHLETSLVSLAGETEYFDGTYVPRIDAQGRIAGLIGYFRNVTERKQVEEVLRKSEAGLAEAQRIAHVGNWEWDAATDTPTWSKELCAILEVDPTEPVPKLAQQHKLYTLESMKRMNSAVEKAMQTGAPYEIELERVRADGTRKWLLARGEPVYDEKRQITGLRGTALDITERKLAEEELRIINEELLAVNRIITTTTTTTGVQGILENVLDEVLSVTGLEGGTICLVAPDDTLQLAAHRATSEATIEDLTTNVVKIGDCLCGACARDHKPLILADREAVLRFATREATRGEDIRFHAAFPLLAAEECLGVLCVFTRTDKKPIERSLKLLEAVSSQIALAVENAQLYEETLQHTGTLEGKVKERTEALEENQRALMNVVEDLNEKSEALKAANVKLTELDRLKSMFIASMSHELRTPLNSIIGFTGIILQGMSGEINAEQRDQLKRVYRSAKHLLALINDVIDISKIEAGKIDIRVEAFDLEDVIHEAISTLRPEMDGKGLDLHLNLPSGWTLRTDRKRLLQCILNFLSNAVKFTPKGSITVDIHQIHDMVEIEVKDTGIGIKAEDMPRLFGSFIRFDSPIRTTTLGTGLGLYLTKKLAEEALHGLVSATSVFGKGSTFGLRIPMDLTGEAGRKDASIAHYKEE